MKYFTKEWYDLMQRQFSTSGLRRIPDKPYSDREIKQFYHQQLQEEIERDRLKKEHEESMERFRNRLPFDPTETI